MQIGIRTENLVKEFSAAASRKGESPKATVVALAGL